MSATATDIVAALAALNLAPRGAPEPLSGGVSCDVFRVETAAGPVCVKRALPRLRVAADWKAPVERSHSEVRWLQTASEIPGVLAPRVIAEHEPGHLFVMSWFEPADHPVWKAELAAGRVSRTLAAQVGAALAAIHSAAARRPQLAADFRTDELFHALRLEPYLLHAARAHPDLAPQLEALSRETLARNVTLVHGDVSPKNILAGPHGPVFLDAECAWWGDPAFDVAFCLNHLLLKCIWRPPHATAYLEAFDALRRAYLDAVDWEPPAALDGRAARLLAGLLLARVDGKSPVEYLREETDRAFVRAAARAFIANTPPDLAALAAAWAERTRTL